MFQYTSSFTLPSISSHVLASFCLLIVFLVVCLQQRSQRRRLPIANPGGWLGLSTTGAKASFVQNARGVFDNIMTSSGRQNFEVNSEFGPLTVLLPEFTQEVGNNPKFSFSRFMAQHTMSNYPGFEVFSEGAHDSELLRRVIRSHLSKGLDSLTVPISDETTFAMSQTFTDRKDWHAIPLKHMVMEIVVRISSRIFTGPELCRDPEWLEISIQYTISAMRAVHELRRYHPLARPIMHWYLSSCRVLRRMIKKTRMIMNRVIGNRQLEQHIKGRIDHNDALEWFEQNAKGQAYDPAITQLVLMFVSAHTTTDLLTQVILDLAKNQEWIEPLRAEVQAELAKNGWGGFSPHNLKLLDSVIKETQRLKPIGITSMRRIATETVQLSDGTSIAKGTSLMVLADRHWDHSLYNDANRFQGDRFLRKRAERGNDAAASLVGISPNHLGFGYGLHACPGRFFAALEVKIVMCHILLKYNWKLPVGEDPQPRKIGVFLDSDPVAVVNIQSRDEEVKL